jgi:hypothetical protein
MRNSNSSAKLFLVTKPQPPAALVQEALDSLLLSRCLEFANALAMARAMWQKYGPLVEADQFLQSPAELRLAFLDESKFDPDEELPPAIPNIPRLRKELLQEARQIAANWMSRRRQTSVA